MILTLISFIYPAFSLLVILCLVIKNWTKIEHKNLKLFIFPLALIFGIYGYSMFFNGRESDLTRYYDSIRLLEGIPLKQILLNDTELLYTKDILFHFVSLTQDVNILAFVVGFIIYGITFYVLFDMIDRSNRKFKTYEIFLLGIICVGIISPYTIICNVRCVLSYIIISLAVYRELIQKKRNLLTYLLYLIPLGLHSSAIIIIVIRIISVLFKKINKLSFIIALLLPKIIDFFYLNVKIGFGSIGKLISNVINKSYYYLHWTEGGWATEVESSISNVVFRFTGAVFLVSIIILILFSNYSKEKNKKIVKDSMVNYLLFVAILALGTLSIKTGAFWRFEAIVVLFSPIIFIKLLENNIDFSKKINYFYILGVVLFLVNIVYQIRNLSLYGYYVTIQNFVTTSNLKIVFEMIKGISRII